MRGGKLEALPRWAQREILGLRGEVERLRRPKGQPSLVWHGHEYQDGREYLNDKARVTFQVLGDRDNINGRVEVHMDRDAGTLEIMASYALDVIPRTRNTVSLLICDHITGAR